MNTDQPDRPLAEMIRVFDDEGNLYCTEITESRKRHNGF